MWDLPPLPPVTGNAANLRVALMQVILGLPAGVGGGALYLSARAEQDWAVLEIRRSAAPALAETGAAGVHLAQRLAVARKELARHGGTLTCREGPEGATATVRLPLESGAQPAEAPAPAPDVLIVDGDEKLLALAEDCLGAAGLQVQTVSSGLAAVRRFEQYAQHGLPGPGVVITELRLPDLLGTGLAQRVKQLSPQTRVVLLSAYVHEYAGLDSSPYLDAVLSKPFNFSDLLRAARGA